MCGRPGKEEEMGDEKKNEKMARKRGKKGKTDRRKEG